MRSLRRNGCGIPSPAPPGAWGLNPTQGSPNQSHRDGKRSPPASGGGNQWGFSRPGILTTPRNRALLKLEHQRGVIPQGGRLVRPSCHTWVLLRDLLATPSSDFKGPSIFWQRPRVNCLYDLGKRTLSPTSITQLAPLPLPVELLGLPSPAGLVVRGGSHTEPGEASVPEPDGQVLGCGYIARKQIQASCKFSHHCLGKKCSPISYRLAGTTPHRRQFGSAQSSPRYPQWAQWGEGKVAQSGSILSVRLSEATVWDQDQVLSPCLWARQASFPMGNWSIPKPRAGKLASVEGTADVTKLNRKWAPLGKLELETGRSWRAWLSKGLRFPHLSAWLHDSQVGDPLAPYRLAWALLLVEATFSFLHFFYLTSPSTFIIFTMNRKIKKIFPLTHQRMS